MVRVSRILYFPLASILWRFKSVACPALLNPNPSSRASTCVFFFLVHIARTGDPAYVSSFQDTALDSMLSYPMYYVSPHPILFCYIFPCSSAPAQR